MKRFMLVSLMSCLLVGQTSCDWSWIEFGKGVAGSTVLTSVAVAAGYAQGKANAISNGILISALSAVVSTPFASMSKSEASDDSDAPEASDADKSLTREKVLGFASASAITAAGLLLGLKQGWFK